MPDSFDLNRFVEAQRDNYEVALAEIRSGQKRSHWMWYIFPQYEGLGSSAMSRRYSIKSVAEAKAYLVHPLLAPRLLASTEALLHLEGRSAQQIFGPTDELKLRSCATLFASVAPADSVFQRLLEKYFHGRGDEKTLYLLEPGNRSSDS